MWRGQTRFTQGQGFQQVSELERGEGGKCICKGGIQECARLFKLSTEAGRTTQG